MAWDNTIANLGDKVTGDTILASDPNTIDSDVQKLWGNQQVIGGNGTSQPSGSVQDNYTFVHATPFVPDGDIDFATGNVTIGDSIGANTLTIGGASTTIRIPYNLEVMGTTTTKVSETFIVKDKNIEMGAVATPSDVTADGGGITLKGTTDKTLIWDNADDKWTFNQDVYVYTGHIGIGNNYTFGITGKPNSAIGINYIHKWTDTDSSYGFLLVPVKSPASSFTGTHTGYYVANILEGTANWGVGSILMGFSIDNVCKDANGGSVNVDVYGSVNSGINADFNFTAKDIWGWQIFPAISISGTITCTNLFGIYIKDASNTSATNQYQLIIAKPTQATNNYQINLEGSGAGSGLWLGGISGARIFCDSGDNLTIDGTTLTLDITLSNFTNATHDHSNAAGGGVIDHSDINDNEAAKHRIINDAGTSVTELWSALKINTELGSKLENLIEDITPQLGGNLDLNSKIVGGAEDTVTYGATTTLDLSSGSNYRKLTLIGNVTAFNVTNPTLPGHFTVRIIQDGTGNRTISGWDADIIWDNDTVPTLATAANSVDTFVFYFDGAKLRAGISHTAAS